ncbi:MAG: YCF48-related protein [Crocinitomicaceae bacterium]|nr:YCF48-related protein [Crocinitomicaceae bacterium]
MNALISIRLNIIAVLILFPIISSAQWYINPDVPQASRYDDIVFVDENEGWAVGSSGNILHTTDQGLTWEIQMVSNDYLRSVEFVDANIGFCGALGPALYKTTDGGANWENIASTINPVPPGICGLSAPDVNTVYGCGIWSSPAYIIKSTDTGDTWTHIDMSAYATALVDIEFSSPDTGFVVGTANPASDGGIILHTTDGGATWTTKFTTGVSLDYVWKIQSPDGLNFFASVDAVPVTNNLRILKSSDAGDTWVMDTILNTYVYTQLVGFIDSDHGWLGAGSELYETIDGGITWEQVILGSSYNRFFRINDNIAFMSGSEIYKYGGTQVGMEEVPAYDEVHELSVSPNPASDKIHIDLTLNSHTEAQLMLIDMNGKVLYTFLDEVREPGSLTFDYSLADLSAQSLVLVLRSNEGIVYQKLIVE